MIKKIWCGTKLSMSEKRYQKFGVLENFSNWKSCKYKIRIHNWKKFSKLEKYYKKFGIRQNFPSWKNSIKSPISEKMF